MLKQEAFKHVKFYLAAQSQPEIHLHKFCPKPVSFGVLPTSFYRQRMV